MSFRNYDIDNPVSNQYKLMRSCQTIEYAKRMKETNLNRLKTNGQKMNVMDLIDKMDDITDLSDPDLSLSNINHLYQTAESIRKNGEPEWLQIVGLIHDLGKVMYLWGSDENGTSKTTQWGLVGDTYLLGCRLRNTHVYPEFDNLCPDMNNDIYKTDMGIYEKNCGFDKCVITWGHDEYLYDVIKHNRQCKNVNDDFPLIADEIIRYHSFYPYHKYGEYIDIESEFDKLNLEYIKKFNLYDLYTKENKKVDVENLKPYYLNLLLKFFPKGYLIF